MSTTTVAAWPAHYPCDVSTTDPVELARITKAAQDLLWALTARRYGLHLTVDEQFEVSESGCGCPKDDGFCCRLTLPRGPVQEIVEVRLDDTVLPVGEYEWNGQTLRRLNGCWPGSDGCEGPRIEVDYRWGISPGPLGEAAVGEVACEFLAASSSGTCRLPSRVVRLQRQGVEMEFDDAANATENGLLGTPAADAFIRAVNPNRLARAPRVWSIDGPRRVG